MSFRLPARHRVRRARILLTLAPLCAVFGTASCATLMQGSTQQLAIASSPTGARVTIDGQPQGVTPVAPALSRKDLHTVRIELDGYQPFEMKLTRKTSGWVWGNLLFGGIPGLAIDAITGGLYKLQPEQVSATLARGDARVEAGKDRMLVILVREPVRGAERVGQLERQQ